MGVDPHQRCRKAFGVVVCTRARRVLRDPQPVANAASLAQKFLLTEMPNTRGVMMVALSSILPVTGLSAPATGT